MKPWTSIRMDKTRCPTRQRKRSFRVSKPGDSGPTMSKISWRTSSRSGTTCPLDASSSRRSWMK
eukprot:scaffold834_cov244-Pinguiococcus_pyrenoidosus.AAC.15